MIVSGQFKTDMFKVIKAPLEDVEKMIIAQTQGTVDVARVLLTPNGEV